VPPPELCTDNGAMIAWAGAERLVLGLTDTLDTPPHARWPLSADTTDRKPATPPAAPLKPAADRTAS
jgi:N6-L-threonylcarbamoyladenine synthase